MSEWQDISTAPRDGTPIDLWVPWNPEDVSAGRRFADAYRKAGEWWASGEDYDGYDARISGQPTHWMPHPSPPETRRTLTEEELDEIERTNLYL